MACLGLALIFVRCGAPVEKKERPTLAHDDGELVKINVEASRKQKRQEVGMSRSIDELVALGHRRGMKDPAGWAANVYAGDTSAGRLLKSIMQQDKPISSCVLLPRRENMKPETIIQNKIMLALSSAGATMWRNAVAYAWVGKVIHKTDTEVTLSGAYPIQAGLCVGSSDLIGLKTITVTADMVGQQIAVLLLSR